MNAAPESPSPDAAAEDPARPSALVALWRRHPGLRFLVVGALNTVVGLILYSGFILAGLRPEIALMVSTVLGVLNNFFTTGGLVFGNRDPRRLLRFVASYVLVYAVNTALLDGLIALTGIGPIAAQAICIGPVLCLNFLVLRRLVFSA